MSPPTITEKNLTFTGILYRKKHFSWFKFHKDKEIHKINVIFAIKYKTKTAAYLQNITQKFI
jgi:hypothetical protein